MRADSLMIGYDYDLSFDKARVHKEITRAELVIISKVLYVA